MTSLTSLTASCTSALLSSPNPAYYRLCGLCLCAKPTTKAKGATPTKGEGSCVGFPQLRFPQLRFPLEPTELRWWTVALLLFWWLGSRSTNAVTQTRTHPHITITQHAAVKGHQIARYLTGTARRKSQKREARETTLHSVLESGRFCRSNGVTILPVSRGK